MTLHFHTHIIVVDMMANSPNTSLQHQDLGTGFVHCCYTLNANGGPLFILFCIDIEYAAHNLKLLS